MEDREAGTLDYRPAERATRAEVVSATVRMLECLTGDEIAP